MPPRPAPSRLQTTSGIPRAFSIALTIALASALAGCGSDELFGDSATASAQLEASVEPSAQRIAQDEARAEVVVRWVDAALAAIRDEKPGPPMVARALAMVDTAMYDAWSHYDATANPLTPLAGVARRPPAEHTAANKAVAISFAAYRTLVDLYPFQAFRFDALMATLGYSVADTRVDPVTPEGIGHRVAQALLAARHDDGANQLGNRNGGAPYSDYTGYRSLNPAIDPTLPTTPDQIPFPDRWQTFSRTDFAIGQGVNASQTSIPFVGAQWGNVRPFALLTASQFRPPAPAPAGTPAFVAQAKQVLDLQAALTDREKVIAEYWADGPESELPPGHWHLIARYVSRRDRHTIDQDARLFFALGNAMHDAAIAIWEAKRFYDYVRPITAIRHLYYRQLVLAWGGPDRGTRPVNGELWLPFQVSTFITPPFAEYPSGHSGYSAAGAVVLRNFTGSDAYGGRHVQPAGSLRIEPNVPREPVVLEWPTFTAAADEAGMSRLYGGIHFMDGNLNGRDVGLLVGEQAWRKARGYWEGTAR